MMSLVTFMANAVCDFLIDVTKSSQKWKGICYPELECLLKSLIFDTVLLGEKKIIQTNGMYLFILLVLCIQHIAYLRTLYLIGMRYSIYNGHKCLVGWVWFFQANVGLPGPFYSFRYVV